MKLIQGTHKASKFKPEDFISNMPDNVVTNIMNRLRLKEAVRTGILSRNWRFKWTLLSQLVFDRNFFDCFKGAKDKTDIGRIISRILLHIRGVVTKFVLSIDEACYSISVEEEISHWIVFLSRTGIKDITLEMRNELFHEKPLKLPAHLFSCMELKCLKLFDCCFDLPTSFHGFPNLLSLGLHNVKLENRKFVKLFSECPILENLEVNHSYGSFLDSMSIISSKVKLAKIAKLANLKRLSLLLCMVDKPGSSSILELVGFLPKLEELCLYFLTCKITEEGVAATRCPTTFLSLKTLNLSDLDISNGIGLSYALQMINSFPNLRTLVITSCYKIAIPTLENCSLKIDYKKMGLPQLRSVVLTYLTASKNEVGLIKYLLACSPFLKKIRIRLLTCVASDQKFKFSTKLLKLQRASSEVNIDLY